MESDSASDEIFDVTGLVVTPDKSKVEEGITIDLKFLPKKDVESIHWRLTYIIDTPKKRIVVTLYKEEESHNYTAGKEAEWHFKCEDITIEGVKKKDLLNIGQLALEAAEDADFEKKTLLKINMMVSVSEDKEKGELHKHIIYELE